MGMRAVRIAQTVLLVLALGLIALLAYGAHNPNDHNGGAPPWRLAYWSGSGDWIPVAITFGIIALLCILTFVARRDRSSATVPVMIVAGLTLTTFVLGLVSYWSCSNWHHPRFFTPLLLTVNLVKGSIGDASLEGKGCPIPPPEALDVARLTIVSAIFISLLGVATAAFRSQSDRLRASLAPSVTVVVDLDDDGLSMIGAIARTMHAGSALVLLTDSPDRACIQAARTQGARVIVVDFNRPAMIGNRRLWRRLDRLYLLSADPPTNLSRLAIITDRLAEVGTKTRIPLVVRIDDPWLAEAWRAQQFGASDPRFGGSDNRWAADAVGIYEITAERLLDDITGTPSVKRVVVCGTSRLTLAVCADMARRHTEREFHNMDGGSALPELILVDGDAAEFIKDHCLRQQQHGFGGSQASVKVLTETPSLPHLDEQVREHEGTMPGRDAVIFTDVASADDTIATRLARRFPSMPVYACDPNALVSAETCPIVGRLRTFRLRMDLPDGQAHDHFERAAMLIHERYRKMLREWEPNAQETPATVPWAQLSDFLKDSNRRQLKNALWMVERIGGHTWNTWDSPPDELTPSDLIGMPARQQLERLGFSDDAIYEMTRREFEDWSRFYVDGGWTYGPKRDWDNKKHENLVSWQETLATLERRKKALNSLAGTLVQLRELGYRSRRMWCFYRRVEHVSAKRRWRRWNWTAESGKNMHASAGDWQVRAGDASWAVKNAVFRKSYRRVSQRRWERTGIVLTRKAKPGEVIRTPEGPMTAVAGDRVVQGERGEHWLVPEDDFKRRYDGPVRWAKKDDCDKLFSDKPDPVGKDGAVETVDRTWRTTMKRLVLTRDK